MTVLRLASNLRPPVSSVKHLCFQDWFLWLNMSVVFPTSQDTVQDIKTVNDRFIPDPLKSIIYTIITAYGDTQPNTVSSAATQ